MIEALSNFQKEFPNRFRFLLDSGAFTAFNSGKTITLDEYCKFLESLPFKPWRYFALDVIGNPEGTDRNYEIMRARGFNPVPIVTYGDNLKKVEDLYKSTDFVGFGGLVGLSKDERIWAVNEITKAVKGRKAHLLGFTQFDSLKRFKPYCCDSSSWSGVCVLVLQTFMSGKVKC